MRSLGNAIKKARGLMVQGPESSGDEKFSLAKAVRAAKELQGISYEENVPETLTKLDGAILKAESIKRESETMDLVKGRHDALYHHASHQNAADSARYQTGADSKKCAEASRLHMHQFLKHALEAVKDRDAYSMKYGLQKIIDFYCGEASSDLYTGGKPTNESALVKHFISGGGFVASPEDKK